MDISSMTLEQLYEFKDLVLNKIKEKEFHKRIEEYKSRLEAGYPVFTMDQIEGYESQSLYVRIYCYSDTRSKSRNYAIESMKFDYISDKLDDYVKEQVAFVSDHIDKVDVDDVDYEDYDDPVTIRGTICVNVYCKTLENLKNNRTVHEAFWLESRTRALFVPINDDEYKIYDISKNRNYYKDATTLKVDDNDYQYNDKFYKYVTTLKVDEIENTFVIEDLILLK